VLLSDVFIVSPGGGDQLEVRGSTLLFKATLPPPAAPSPCMSGECLPASGAIGAQAPERVEAFWVLDGGTEFELDGQANKSPAPAASFWSLER
jgi:hypothetical protein